MNGQDPRLGARFDQALVYASEIHRAQRRKGSDVPYVAHLLGVASIALEAGADEDQAIAALLHDSVEDQGGLPRLEEVRRLFGDRVAGIVADCTDSWEDPKPAWAERKAAYIAGLAHKDPDSLLVSLADKTHNALAIVTDLAAVGDALWERFTGDREGILAYYAGLAKVFDERLAGSAAQRFRALVEEMHRLADQG